MSWEGVKSILFVLIIVVITTVIAGMAQVSISDRAERAVYGGVIALLAGMYWQQRRINGVLIEGIDAIRKLIAPKGEGV